MPIHTFGDSHSYHGWSNVKIHHLGPILCYSFGKEKLNRCDIRKFDVKDGDSVVFCFGEIDCRCHIHKHITETATYQDIINDIVNKYFDAIELNISVLQKQLKNVCVFNVVPPIEKHNTKEESMYPFLGTDEERKRYVLYFNKRLEEKCRERQYVFINVYNKYIDDNGFLNKKLSDGNVHVHNGEYISEFIKENNV